MKKKMSKTRLSYSTTVKISVFVQIFVDEFTKKQKYRLKISYGMSSVHCLSRALWILFTKMKNDFEIRRL